jgi:hypothetical protein
MASSESHSRAESSAPTSSTATHIRPNIGTKSNQAHCADLGFHAVRSGYPMELSDRQHFEVLGHALRISHPVDFRSADDRLQF